MRSASRLGFALLALLVLAACGDLTRQSHQISTELNRALEAQLENRASDAVAHYRHALEYGPNVVASYNLGLLAQNDGDDVAAALRYGEALVADPSYAPALFNFGLVSIETGEYAEAVDLYERLLEVAPQDAAAHWNLSLALAALGRDEEAEVEASVAIALDPSYGE
jgi:tetratricopeptide (TPR) repeat protein